MIKKLLLVSTLLNVMMLGAGLYLMNALGGFNYMLHKVRNRGVSAIYEHKKQLFEVLSSDSASIVFLGNSLTAYGEWGEYFNTTKIKNRGIPGDMTSGVLNRLPNILNQQPRQLFLMIGVNDLLFSSPEKILRNYQKIIEQVKSKSEATELYLQSLLPVNNQVRNTQIRNEDILLVNQGLQKLAQQHQLTYIDLHPHFQDEQGHLKAEFTVDGIHLNGNAYLIWKEVLKKHLDI